MRDSFVPSEDASATLLGDGRPAPHKELELPRGSQVGRYVVLAPLGAGAMGVVVAAYDPELDRKVALKLLHPRDDRRAQLAQRRLLAEAQALARLSDPNVVAVHDAGVHEGRVFVAMEFVAGQTLEAWLAAAPRPWLEVLDVMTRAGRGLMAAHARELVHRDFKPENVMLGDDGRVRVMDFGLARAEVETSSLDDDTRPRERALDLALTQAGAVVGTPAYMAPEQLAGGRGGAAADQFSFCATLWEALYGQRPFVDETLVGLQARILAGDVAKPPPGRGVPRWLRRTVEQGLAVDPALRWPSMQALLSVLERGRARARGRRVLGVAGTLVLAGAAAVGWQRWQEHRRVRACEAAGASITEVWNDDVAAAMHAAMTGTGVPRAEVTAQKVRPWLDAQASAWQAARTEVCLDAEVYGRWDAETADRAEWCLEARRIELESLVSELGRGELPVIDLAVGIAAGLGGVGTCRDPQALERLPAPPYEGREAVRAVVADLAHAGVLIQAGRHDEALELSRQASAAAAAIGWLPLVASAHYREGHALERAGSYADAEPMLERAYFEAFRADAMPLALGTTSRLVYLVGYDLARRDDGLRWAQHGEVLLTRLTEPSELYTIQHLHALSAVHFAAGDWREVEQLQRAMMPLQERLWGPEHPQIANSLNNLGNACYQLGRYDEARTHYERARAIEEDALGPEHPWIADKIDNLGLVSVGQGRFEEALELHEQALALRLRVLGSEHPTVANTLNNLAVVLEHQKRYDEAIPLLERAGEIWAAKLGPGHPDVALGLANLALIHGRAGRSDEAEALYRRSLAIWEAAVGPEHPDLAKPLQGLALLAIERGRPVEAVPLAQRAARLREAAGLGPDQLGPSHFTLAKALWDSNQDRAHAVALAHRALAEQRERGEAGAEDAAVVEAWLAEHAP